MRKRCIKTSLAVIPTNAATEIAISRRAPLFGEGARRGEMQREGIDLVAGARIDFRDDRIVPRDEAIGVAGEALDDLPALRHVPDIVDDRKRAALLQIGVIVRGVR